MSELFHDPANVWLAVGAIFIAFEAFTAPGLGIFLVGLGAACTAIFIKAGIVGEASTAAQFVWCFAFTIGWAALLWKPLKKFRLGRKTRGGDIQNNNLIGETATVAKGGLRPGQAGQVFWSGTLWSAELASGQAHDLAEGAKVIIDSVSGNVLTVTPR